MKFTWFMAMAFTVSPLLPGTAILSQDQPVCGLVDHLTQPYPGATRPRPSAVNSYSNSSVNDDSPYNQLEVTVATDPTNSNRLAASWVDYRVGNSARIATGFSTDGGISWSDNGVLNIVSTLEFVGDPAIDVDKLGNFYLTYITFSQGYYLSELWIAKSTDGGGTWPTSLMVRLDSEDNVFDDKPWIAVDRSNIVGRSNNIYVFWMHNYGTPSQVYFRRSTNGGSSFDAEFAVSDIARRHQFGVAPVVDPATGNLYVAWHSGTGDAHQYLWFDKSTDGGVSFGTDIQIREIQLMMHVGDYHLNKLERAWTSPSIALNPSNGHIYLTWHDLQSLDAQSLATTDALFIRSTNGGAAGSWSTPINVMNNGIDPSPYTNDQIYPTISVNPAGTRISIVLYDRSDFVNNDLMRVKVVTSIDGGLTFTPPVTISDQDIDPTDAEVEGYPTWLGDYNAMVANGSASQPGKLHPLWADSRNGSWDIFTSPADIEVRLKGTISNNSTLSGTSNVEDHLTVATGKTLSVTSGSVVKFANTKKLTVNGTLVANGTSSSHITFTSSSGSPTKGIWDQIRLNGPYNSLSYCDFRYPSYGVVVANTSTNFIDHSTFTDCSQAGVYALGTLYPSQPDNSCLITNSTFTNTYRGVLASNARATIKYSTIKDNPAPTGYGVYVSNSTLYVDHSTIQNHNTIGVYITGNSAYVGFGTSLLANGCNTLTGSAKQIYFTSGGYGELGAGTLSPLNGYNNVYNPTGFLIQNTTNLTINAKWCYWNSASPSFSGPVTWSDSLTSILCSGGALSIPVVADETESNGNVRVSKGSDRVNDDEPDLSSFPIEEWLGSIKENGVDASASLRRLAAARAEIGDAVDKKIGTSWDQYLIEVENVGSPDLFESARVLRIKTLVDQRSFSEAEALMGSTLKREDLSEDVRFYCESQQIYSALLSGGIEDASSKLSLLRRGADSFNPADVADLAEMVSIFEGGTGLTSTSTIVEDPVSLASTNATPMAYSLEQNYPNPFNPTTSIGYSIPENVHVKISVYDVLGREVATLVNEVQAVGSRTIRFNASALPNGVYFYKMVAGSFTDVKKLLLVK